MEQHHHSTYNQSEIYQGVSDLLKLYFELNILHRIHRTNNNSNNTTNDVDDIDTIINEQMQVISNPRHHHEDNEEIKLKLSRLRQIKNELLLSVPSSSSSPNVAGSVADTLLFSEIDKMRHRRKMTSELAREVESREKLFRFLMTDIQEEINDHIRQGDRDEQQQNSELQSKVRQVAKDLISTSKSLLDSLISWTFTLEISSDKNNNTTNDHEVRLVALCSKFREINHNNSDNNDNSSTTTKALSYLQHFQDTSLEIVSCASFAPFLRKDKEIKQLLFLASDEAVIVTFQKQQQHDDEEEDVEQDPSSTIVRNNNNGNNQRDAEMKCREETRKRLASITKNFGTTGNSSNRVSSAASSATNESSSLSTKNNNNNNAVSINGNTKTHKINVVSGGGVELQATTTFDHVDFRPVSNTSSVPSSVTTQKQQIMNSGRQSPLIGNTSGNNNNTVRPSSTNSKNKNNSPQLHHHQEVPPLSPLLPTPFAPPLHPQHHSHGTPGEASSAMGTAASNNSSSRSQTSEVNSNSMSKPHNNHNNKSVMSFGDNYNHNNQISHPLRSTTKMGNNNNNNITSPNPSPSLASLSKTTFGHNNNHRPQSSITPQPKSISLLEPLQSHHHQQQLLVPVALVARSGDSDHHNNNNNNIHPVNSASITSPFNFSFGSNPNQGNTHPNLPSPLSAGHDHSTVFKKTEVLQDHDPKQQLPAHASNPTAKTTSGDRPWTAVTHTSTSLANNNNGSAAKHDTNPRPAPNSFQRLIHPGSATGGRRLSHALAFSHSPHMHMLGGSGSPVGQHQDLGLDEADEQTFRGSPNSRRGARATSFMTTASNNNNNNNNNNGTDGSPRSSLGGAGHHSKRRGSLASQDLVQIGSVNLPVLDAENDYDDDDEEEEGDNNNDDNSSPAPKRPAGNGNSVPPPLSRQQQKQQREESKQLAISLLQAKECKNGSRADATKLYHELLKQHGGDPEAVVRSLATKHGITLATTASPHPHKSNNNNNNKKIVYVEKRRTRQETRHRSTRDRVEAVLRRSGYPSAEALVPKTQEEFAAMVLAHSDEMRRRHGTVFASDEEAALSLLESLKKKYNVKETVDDMIETVLVDEVYYEEEEEADDDENEEDDNEDDGNDKDRSLRTQKFSESNNFDENGDADTNRKKQNLREKKRYEFKIIRDPKTGEEKVIRVFVGYHQNNERQGNNDDDDDDEFDSSFSSNDDGDGGNNNDNNKVSKRRRRQDQEKKDRCVAILEVYAPHLLCRLEEMLNNSQNNGSIDKLLQTLMQTYYYNNNDDDGDGTSESKRQEVERRIKEFKDLGRRLKSNPLALGIVVRLQSIARRIRTRRAFLQARAIWSMLGHDANMMQLMLGE